MNLVAIIYIPNVSVGISYVLINTSNNCLLRSGARFVLDCRQLS